jgi:hypothetical protein
MDNDLETSLTRFEYRYRDAANFKARGSLYVRGDLSAAHREEIIKRLEDGLFVAEQVGVPPLYEELYQFSDGSTPMDHCWHEFVAISDSQAHFDDVVIWGTAEQLLERFRSVREWDVRLSPHIMA